MGDLIDFKKFKTKRSKPVKRPKASEPLCEKTKTEYEIRQILAIRGYHIDYLQIEHTNGKFIIGMAISR